MWLGLSIPTHTRRWAVLLVAFLLGCISVTSFSFGLPHSCLCWMSGGCKFSGSSTGLVGNSALRFCLLMKWRSVPTRHSKLFPKPPQLDSDEAQMDTDVVSVHPPQKLALKHAIDSLCKQLARPPQSQGQAQTKGPSLLKHRVALPPGVLNLQQTPPCLFAP